jgi:hypothetical protein
MMKASPVKKPAASPAVLARPAAKRSAQTQPATELRSFPHGREIGHLLGRAFSATAKLDPDGCARKGVPAFAAGGRAHFATPEPPLGVAAHEAAHVLQQTGATRDMGLGAEGHAAAVEHEIAAGRQAAGLIGDRGRSAGAGPNHYTVVSAQEQSEAREWQIGADLRVSDDGWMAVEDGPAGAQEFWTTADKAIESNKILAKADSKVMLAVLSEDVTGRAPDDPDQKERTLSKIVAVNLRNASIGKKATFDSDCGRVARTVMGANWEDLAAVYSKIRRGPRVLEETSSESDDPDAMETEIEQVTVGMDDPEKAQWILDALPAKTRQDYDYLVGINRFAQPGVGEAYAMSSGPERWTHYNFHFGAVVMTSGSDRVTLENFADLGTTDWGFHMYGPAAKEGQTFHEQNKETGAQGTDPMTMTTRKRRPKK